MNARRTRLALTIAAILAAPSLGLAQAPELRISTAAPPADVLAKAIEAFKTGIEKDLPGALKVSVHAGSSLFRQGTEVPALQRGNLEMSTMTTFEVEQQIPEYGVLSAGYMFRDYDHMKKFFASPMAKDYTKAVADKMGIEIIDVLYLGTRQTNLRQSRDVTSPADLSGTKLRMPPGPGWVALGKGLGVTPTPMGMPEVYLALKNGAIDGQENPLGITRATNMHEVTQQIVLTQHLVQPVFFAFAKPFWDKLTPAQQDAIRKQARATAEDNDKARLADEQELVKFFQTAGLKISKIDVAPFRASVAKQYEAEGLAAKWLPGLAEKIADLK